MTYTCIFKVVVYKFSHIKVLFLVILRQINENPEINFYYTILTLYLAIHLEVEGC